MTGTKESSGNADDDVIGNRESAIGHRQLDSAWSWVVCAGMVMIMILGMGAQRSYGLFYVEMQDKFQVSASAISLVGGTLSATISLGALVTMTFLIKILSERQCIMIGVFMITSALSLSSLVTSFPVFVFTLGGVTGFAWSMIYGPMFVLLGKYFSRHLVLAQAVVNSGVSAGGLVLPFVVRAVLDRFSFPSGLLLIGGLLCHMFVFASLFTPVATPVARRAATALSHDGGDDVGDGDDGDYDDGDDDDASNDVIKCAEHNYSRVSLKQGGDGGSGGDDASDDVIKCAEHNYSRVSLKQGGDGGGGGGDASKDVIKCAEHNYSRVSLKQDGGGGDGACDDAIKCEENPTSCCAKMVTESSNFENGSSTQFGKLSGSGNRGNRSSEQPALREHYSVRLFAEKTDNHKHGEASSSDALFPTGRDIPNGSSGERRRYQECGVGTFSRDRTSSESGTRERHATGEGGGQLHYSMHLLAATGECRAASLDRGQHTHEDKHSTNHHSSNQALLDTANITTSVASLTLPAEALYASFYSLHNSPSTARHEDCCSAARPDKVRDSSRRVLGAGDEECCLSFSEVPGPGARDVRNVRDASDIRDAREVRYVRDATYATDATDAREVRYVTDATDARPQTSRRKCCPDGSALSQFLDPKTCCDRTLWALVAWQAFGLLTGALGPAFLPPLAREKGLTDTQATFLLTLIGGLDIVSRLSPGVIAHYQLMKPRQMALLSLTLQGLLCQFLAYFNTFHAMVGFCVGYGCLSGVFFSMGPAVVVATVGLDRFPVTFGFIMLFNGLSASVAYPLVGALRDATGSYVTSFHFLGATELTSAAILLALPWLSRGPQAKGDKSRDVDMDVEVTVPLKRSH